jgi:thiol-disulfide isomerase/thioredoxin
MALFVLCGCYSRTPAVKTGLEGKPMPAIELIAADSVTHFNTADIPVGKPTVLFLFETWCPYCKAQTNTLLSDINTIKDFNIIMICNTGFSKFKEFYDKYHIYEYPNVKSGVDYKFTFINYFKTNDVPYIAVYDKEKKLKDVFKGRTTIRNIKNSSIE